jgi:DNA-nicking Smr family endonuclease
MDAEPDPVTVPIEDSLDLHSFPPRDIPEIVEEYLHAARAAGLREVRLIHGRGQGVQRARVHSLLARLPGIAAAFDAPSERGGWGATVVVLANVVESRKDAGI